MFQSVNLIQLSIFGETGVYRLLMVSYFQNRMNKPFCLVVAGRYFSDFLFFKKNKQLVSIVLMLHRYAQLLLL